MMTELRDHAVPNNSDSYTDSANAQLQRVSKRPLAAAGVAAAAAAASRKRRNIRKHNFGRLCSTDDSVKRRVGTPSPLNSSGSMPRTDRADTEGYYPCRICGKVCTSAQQLGGHQNSHRDEKLREGGRIVPRKTNTSELPAESEETDPEDVAVHQPSSVVKHVQTRVQKPATTPTQKVAAAAGRARPTNNQLLYKAHFRWEHYQGNIDEEALRLPTSTEACASVTSAFLQVLRAVYLVEKKRRNILKTLSGHTRRTKVVALASGSHRVPDELRRHSLGDEEGNEYSTNLDRNRYGNDDQYLSTVIRYDLEFLGLCPALVDVQIIDAKSRGETLLISVGTEGCICGGQPLPSPAARWGAAGMRTSAQHTSSPPGGLGPPASPPRSDRPGLRKPSSARGGDQAPPRPAALGGIDMLLDAMAASGAGGPLSPPPGTPAANALPSSAQRPGAGRPAGRDRRALAPEGSVTGGPEGEDEWEEGGQRGEGEVEPEAAPQLHGYASDPEDPEDPAMSASDGDAEEEPPEEEEPEEAMSAEEEDPEGQKEQEAASPPPPAQRFGEQTGRMVRGKRHARSSRALGFGRAGAEGGRRGSPPWAPDEGVLREDRDASLAAAADVEEGDSAVRRRYSSSSTPRRARGESALQPMRVAASAVGASFEEASDTTTGMEAQARAENDALRKDVRDLTDQCERSQAKAQYLSENVAQLERSKEKLEASLTELRDAEASAQRQAMARSAELEVAQLRAAERDQQHVARSLEAQHLAAVTQQLEELLGAQQAKLEAETAERVRLSKAARESGLPAPRAQAPGGEGTPAAAEGLKAELEAAHAASATQARKFEDEVAAIEGKYKEQMEMAAAAARRSEAVLSARIQRLEEDLAAAHTRAEGAGSIHLRFLAPLEEAQRRCSGKEAEASRLAEALAASEARALYHSREAETARAQLCGKREEYDRGLKKLTEQLDMYRREMEGERRTKESLLHELARVKPALLDASDPARGAAPHQPDPEGAPKWGKRWGGAEARASYRMTRLAGEPRSERKPSDPAHSSDGGSEPECPKAFVVTKARAHADVAPAADVTPPSTRLALADADKGKGKAGDAPPPGAHGQGMDSDDLPSAAARVKNERMNLPSEQMMEMDTDGAEAMAAGAQAGVQEAGRADDMEGHRSDMEEGPDAAHKKRRLPSGLLSPPSGLADEKPSQVPAEQHSVLKKMRSALSSPMARRPAAQPSPAALPKGVAGSPDDVSTPPLQGGAGLMAHPLCRSPTSAAQKKPLRTPLQPIEAPSSRAGVEAATPLSHASSMNNIESSSDAPDPSSPQPMMRRKHSRRPSAGSMFPGDPENEKNDASPGATDPSTEPSPEAKSVESDKAEGASADGSPSRREEGWRGLPKALEAQNQVLGRDSPSPPGSLEREVIA